MAQMRLHLLAIIVTAAFCQALPCGSEPVKAAGKVSPRIVSLAPSNTELVCALGGIDNLVAVSDVCDFPVEVLKKPKVGSFVALKMEKLAALKPDMVLLVNGQERALINLQQHKIPASLLSNHSIADIAANTCTIGKSLGKEKLSGDMARELRDSVGKFKTIVAAAKSKPRVFICVWPSPLMTAGATSFVSEAVTTCGAENIAAGIKSDYPVISLEKLVVAKPDVIIFPHEAVSQDFWQKGVWKTLPASRNGKLFFLPPPADDPLLRPTFRVLEGLYWVGTRVHPELSAQLEEWRRGWRDRLKKLGTNF